MAITFISNIAAQSGDTATVTTGTVTTTGATLLVVAVSDDTAGGAVQTLQDSKSNTWVSLTPVGSSTNTRAHLYYCAASPTVGTLHTFTYTGGISVYPSIYMAAFAGTDSAAFDTYNHNGSAGSTTTTPGSVTPANANSLVVSMLSLVNARTIAIDSSLSITDQNQFNGSTALGGGLAYIIQTSIVTENPVWSWDATSIENSAAIAVFKPAGGGGGGTVAGTLALLGVGS
jgi:hypothetical protein